MKKIYLLIFIAILSKSNFAQNLQLQANMSYGPIVLANIGGYVDSLNNEYALVGTSEGLDIVDVTDPSNPVIRFSVPGPQSNWREVKTYRKFAYVTTEGGGGLVIVDMSQLPDTVFYKSYIGDGNIVGQLSEIHALHCDTAKGFLYLYGTQLSGGSTLFIDLSDPWNPTYAGNYVFPTGGQDEYVHDGYVLNDTMYESHIYSGFFTIVDVTNKANPVLLATQTTPTAFTHNTWLSDDRKTLFTTDENSGSYLGAYDISDPGNIQELSRFQTATGSNAVIHNTHILNDYAIVSWYREGVVIVDVDRPANPIEVAHYDTYAGSGDGMDGCWGVYPFLPSGTIVASDMTNGLFVLTPTYIRGCYLEGIVSDSISSALLNGALVEILTTTLSKNTNASGEYKTGTVTSGTYNIRISKPGYNSKTITGVQLANGVLTQLDVLLSPLQTYAFSGTVTDSLSGQPLSGVQVLMEGEGLTYTALSGVGGTFTFPGIPLGNFTMHTGKWGYQSKCTDYILSQGMSLSEVLSEGYYDDFTLNFGWTVSGTSPNSWERGDPIGTFNNSNVEINPEDDVTSDCGSYCFVTDNGGEPYNNNDVDNGNTILSSPIFDATIYVDPYINYYHRFLDIDGFGQPNDLMDITLSNGLTSVLIESIDATDPSNGTWVSSAIQISNLIAPTANMQLSIEVSDLMPGNIVEGAIDQFEITGVLWTKIDKTDESIISFSAFPNPFSNEITINYDLKLYSASSVIIVKDILGRELIRQKISDVHGKLQLGKNLSAGIYIVILENGNTSIAKKIVKE